MSESNIIIDNSSIVDHKMISPLGKLSVGKQCVINGELVCMAGSIDIGNYVVINQNTRIISACKIIIEDNVMISWGCNIIDSNMHSMHSADRLRDTQTAREAFCTHTLGQNVDYSNIVSKPIIIKENAWIGFNAIIMKGITIGRGAIVGAGSVVAQDVPDFAVVAGNPAKIVKYTD
jgi:acetyltransferase-like isoleucine patch superfamily enzyme